MDQLYRKGKMFVWIFFIDFEGIVCCWNDNRSVLGGLFQTIPRMFLWDSIVLVPTMNH
jgi:hypothetical protein